MNNRRAMIMKASTHPRISDDGGAVKIMAIRLATNAMTDGKNAMTVTAASVVLVMTCRTLSFNLRSSAMRLHCFTITALSNCEIIIVRMIAETGPIIAKMKSVNFMSTRSSH